MMACPIAIPSALAKAGQIWHGSRVLGLVLPPTDNCLRSVT